LFKNKAIEYHYLILVISWIAAAILVNPLKNIPLNDDWVYARTVFQFVSTGNFVLDDWIGVTLYSHVLWGSLFVWIFGPSFTVLRIASLLMSLLIILLSYKLLRDLVRNTKLAFFITLFIAFNPVFFNLAFTFMSDITFFGFVLLSNLFYFRAIRDKDTRPLYFATFFAILATLARQIGLFLPLSALLLSVVLYWKTDKRHILVYLVHVIIVASVFLAYMWWLKESGNKPESYRELGEAGVNETFLSVLFSRLISTTGKVLSQVGLWFFPLILFFTVKSWVTYRQYLKSAIVPTLILGGLVMLSMNHFPDGNIFYLLGLGPRTLVDSFIFDMKSPLWNTPWLIIPVKTLAFSGGFLISWLLSVNLVRLLKNFGGEFSFLQKIKLFSLLQIIVYQGVFLGSFTYFDRYVIILYIPLLIFALPENEILEIHSRKVFRSIEWGFLAMIIYFSIAGTHDYLSWNSARWKAAFQLEEQGIDKDVIDGGHEYNGWKGVRFNKMGKWDPSEAEYALSFHEMPGYDVLDEKEFSTWLPFTQRFIFVLKRKAVENDASPGLK